MRLRAEFKPVTALKTGAARLLRAVNETRRPVVITQSGEPRGVSWISRQYKSLAGPKGNKFFEAYAEQNTSAAFRVFWHYGPGREQITIVAITRYP